MYYFSTCYSYEELWILTQISNKGVKLLLRTPAFAFLLNVISSSIFSIGKILHKGF